ncbi:MAG: hypothetical protein D3926_05740 [Desulfobacteraceae bacterium]|nr:MAG: hypothetical protein D3926_05740 [Desulfobacteraceae bacterium]
METYSLKGGTYAVFNHHGPASTAGKTMQTIFGMWFMGPGKSRQRRADGSGPLYIICPRPA